MKHILLLFICPFFLMSQNSNHKIIDSLLLEIDRQEVDSLKVDLYQEICINVKKDLNKLTFYNNKVFELSNSIKYCRGKGFYYYNLSLIHRIKDKDDIKSTKKALEFFSKIKDTNYILLTKYQLAVSFSNIEKYEDAKKVALESLQLSQKISNYKLTGDFYSFLGFIHYRQKKLAQSFKYYKNALGFYEKNKNDNDKDALYVYISYVLTDLEMYNEALYYLYLSNENRIDNNIQKAIVFNKLERYEEALDILLKNQSSKIYKTKDFAIYNSLTLARTYFNLKKYKIAITTLEEIFEEGKTTGFYIEYYNLLSKCYLKLKDIDKANKYNFKALSVIDKTSFSNTKQEILFTRSSIEENSKNYKDALSYYKKQALLKEKYLTKINKESLIELWIYFEIKEKNNRIKRFKISELDKEIKIKRQNYFLILFFFLLFIALMLIFIFYKINTVSKNKNKIINNNNIKLKKAIVEKELLLKEIHHRVKNNLQLVMSLLYVQSKQKDTNIDYFIEVSQSRIISMALIHENIYQTSDLSKVDYKAYINNLAQSILTAQNDINKEIQLNVEVDAVFLDIQIAIPLGLIINELVNNAFKHAFKNHSKGIINLILKKKNEEFELEISDNGEGISDNQIARKSLGLELVKQLVNQIQGVFQVDNNFGVHFYIKFKNEIV